MESYVRIGHIFLFAVFVGLCHGKYCYYDMNFGAFYCKQDCTDGTSIVGGVVGGVLAVAIVIGITVCVSVHLKFKQHGDSPHQNNGAPQQRPNTIPPLHATNSNNGPPPAYMYQEPTGTRQTGTHAYM